MIFTKHPKRDVKYSLHLIIQEYKKQIKTTFGFSLYTIPL